MTVLCVRHLNIMLHCHVLRKWTHTPPLRPRCSRWWRWWRSRARGRLWAWTVAPLLGSGRTERRLCAHWRRSYTGTGPCCSHRWERSPWRHQSSPGSVLPWTTGPCWKGFLLLKLCSSVDLLSRKLKLKIHPLQSTLSFMYCNISGGLSQVLSVQLCTPWECVYCGCPNQTALQKAELSFNLMFYIYFQWLNINNE